ncbi:MAG: endonuclease V [Candidatus Omnitrophica bacterium]|nr:endonuclease V [Candidatus Omnitrophota bacterium]MBD3269072.1 endonuclease V [Candidatus Omnitrophota bacterium]
MHYKTLHPWRVSPKEAVQIQKRLAGNIRTDTKNIKPKAIAGIDVSFKENTSCAAICIFKIPGLKLIEEKTKIAPVTFPYISTLFTFREGPPVLGCLKKIKTVPDVIIFDGQGIAHPRRMGLATHMGLWLNIPTIGCAKTLLYGKFTHPSDTKGSYTLLKDKNATIGAVVRTKDKTKPLFISAGHLINLRNAIEITLQVCTKYRLPEPIRAAHTLSKATLLKELRKG